MNYKLIEGHGIHECAKLQGFLLSHLATRVFELSKNAKNKKNQRKLKLTSSLFIIYLHNELQTCSRSWNLLGCNISQIFIFVNFIKKWQIWSLKACSLWDKLYKKSSDTFNILHSSSTYFIILLCQIWWKSITLFW